MYRYVHGQCSHYHTQHQQSTLRHQTTNKQFMDYLAPIKFHPSLRCCRCAHSFHRCRLCSLYTCGARKSLPFNICQSCSSRLLHLYPQLTSNILSANPPLTIATAQGHLDQHRQGQHSTKTPVQIFDTDADSDSESDTDSIPNTRTPTLNQAYTQIVLISDTLHSDLTGRFPVTSNNGAQYIFVSILDGYIHVETMKSRHHTDYIAAYKRTLNFFARLGRRPAFQRLDNETSGQLESFALSSNITIQYCPPHTHRSLKAERAIRTFKNHFIATLCTVAPDFPLQLWDELLPQVEVCLNHLIPYSPNPSVSAYAGIHGGAFNFAQHPIAPVGTKVLIHDKPSVRASWAPHGVSGYYLGPAMQHYRSYRVWSSATKAIRIADTVAWFPHGLKVPGFSAHDALLATVDTLKSALTEFARLPQNFRNTPQPARPLINSVINNLLELVGPSAPSADISQDTHAPTHTKVVHESPMSEIESAREQRVPSSPSTVAPPVPLFTADLDRVLPPPRPTIPPPPALHSPITPSPPPQIATPNTRITSLSPTRVSIPLPPQLIRLDAHMPSSVANSTLNLDDSGQPLRYATAKQGENASYWQLAEAEELDRLLTTETIRPILNDQQPLTRRRDTTYYNPQTKEKENAAGERTYRIRGTIGGDRVNYPGPTTARTAAMPLVKILLHSVISDNSHWLTIDIKDYYLNTPLPRPEYLRIALKFIPPTTLRKYNLQSYVRNNAVLFEVNKVCMAFHKQGCSHNSDSSLT